MSHRQLSHTWLPIVSLWGAVVLGACAPTAEYRRPETQDERARSVAAGVAEIVGARCDMEVNCSNVGPGQKYDTRSMCESKMQGETASSLNTADCPLGVEPRKLDACIASIMAQDCGNMFDALNRWNACRNGQICYR